jgi:hypothetical protein
VTLATAHAEAWAGVNATTEGELTMNTPTTAAPDAATLIRDSVEHEGARCPYCGSERVEHVEAIDTSDWTYEVESWICLEPSCEDRTFRIEYVVDRNFVGVRTDDESKEDDDEGTLHRPEATARTFFEATLPGFDGSTDATDHLVKWIQAPDAESVRKLLPGANVVPLTLTPDESDIDAVIRS